MGGGGGGGEIKREHRGKGGRMQLKERVTNRGVSVINTPPFSLEGFISVCAQSCVCGASKITTTRGRQRAHPLLSLSLFKVKKKKELQ